MSIKNCKSDDQKISNVSLRFLKMTPVVSEKPEVCIECVFRVARIGWHGNV